MAPIVELSCEKESENGLFANMYPLFSLAYKEKNDIRWQPIEGFSLARMIFEV